MLDIKQTITSFFSSFPDFSWLCFWKSNVEKDVINIMSKHADTLETLEKYDQGQIEEPEALAKFSNVQDYLQHLQTKSKQNQSPTKTSRTSS